MIEDRSYNITVETLRSMKVTVHIHLKQMHEILYNTKDGLLLLSDFIKKVKACSFADEVYIWAESEIIKALEELITGEEIKEIHTNKQHCRLGFPEADLFRESAEPQLTLLEKSLGDVFLYIDPSHVLFSNQNLENMFDQLMEDDQAHVIYPVYNVDPHIYLKTSQNEEFYPVWEYPGLDRQKYPQLFRKVGIYIFHTGRQRYKQPIKEAYYSIPWIEGKKYLTTDWIAFAKFQMFKQEHQL